MKNTFKRSIAVLLTLAMMALMVPAFLTVGVSADVWDGAAVATGYSGGDGTQANPYLISTAAELVLLGNDAANSVCTAETYYKLTADIDLNNNPWNPIGLKETPFKGHFDGDGHIVSGLSVLHDLMVGGTYGGLFGMARDAIFENLTIEGVVVHGRYVGTLLGYGINVDVINCHARSANVEGAAIEGAAMGGLIGRIQEGPDKNKIMYCTNSAYLNNDQVTVSGGDNFIGGIVGVAGNTEISYCANFGKINVSRPYNNAGNPGEGVTPSKKSITAGGIVGNMGASNGICDVYYCYNTADITGFEEATTAANSCAGGIAGRVAHTPGSTIIGSFSTGTVTWPFEQGGTDLSVQAGGLFGKIVGAATMSNCYTIMDVIKGEDSRGETAVDVDVKTLTLDQMTGNAALTNMSLGTSMEDLISMAMATSNYYDSQLKAFEKYTEGKSLETYMNDYVRSELNISGSADCWIANANGTPTFGSLEAILASSEVSAKTTELTNAKLADLYALYLADPENTTTEEQDVTTAPTDETSGGGKVTVIWDGGTTNNPTGNVTNKPSDNVTGAPTTTAKPEEKGCGGLVSGIAAVIAVVCVSAAVVVIKKKY